MGVKTAVRSEWKCVKGQRGVGIVPWYEDTVFVALYARTDLFFHDRYGAPEMMAKTFCVNGDGAVFVSKGSRVQVAT